MKKLIFTGLLVIFSSSVYAQQTVTPTSKFTWDQSAQDLATASAYTYNYYADGAATGTVFSNVVCVAGATSTVFTCSVPVPAFTPGSHTIQLTASNAAGESTKGVLFPFSMIIVPAAPANLRITQ